MGYIWTMRAQSIRREYILPVDILPVCTVQQLILCFYACVGLMDLFYFCTWLFATYTCCYCYNGLYIKVIVMSNI